MPNAPAQPTYKRQRFLLAFMRQLNEAVSATDLQKLVFLCSMTQDEHYYDSKKCPESVDSGLTIP